MASLPDAWVEDARNLDNAEQLLQSAHGILLETPAIGDFLRNELHDWLMARLDRLDSVKRVAQIGAAIGREFSYTLLRIVSGLYEDELQAALGRLVASELVFERGTPPDAVYSFKHALIQDAAHGSLLRGTRQQLHARIAGALEAHSPEAVDSQPELFAQHYAGLGSLKNPLPIGARLVVDRPPARRCRKRQHNFRRR